MKNGKWCRGNWERAAWHQVEGAKEEGDEGVRTGREESWLNTEQDGDQEREQGRDEQRRR